MQVDKALKYAVMLGIGILLGGCAMFEQPKDVALVREPGQRHYGPPMPVFESAERLWEYAVLSSNVYHGGWKPIENLEQTAKLEAPSEDTNPYVRACVSDPAGLLPLNGWTLWPDFPSSNLRADAVALGLYVEVWENAATPQTVAVVFKGTEFDSGKDWRSNLRWFTRFIPGFADQYTLLSKDLGKEFVEDIVKRKPALHATDDNIIRIVATGHSLGGGLAQHFAYSLPLKSSSGIETPRVSHVYAFDPSPVTGWYSVDDVASRTCNADGLKIDRVFEHGEILAYLRLVQSYLYPPSDANPAVREIRYNFVRSANILSSHSMLHLACNLAQASAKVDKR